MHDEVHDHFKTASYILIFLLVILLLHGVYRASFIQFDQGIGDLMSITFGILFIVPSAIFMGLIIFYLKLQNKHYDMCISDALWIILLGVYILFMVCLVLYGSFCVLIFLRATHWMTIVTVLLTLIAIGNVYFPASMMYHLIHDEK